MAKMRIVAENFSDTAILTADPALVAETPVSNLTSTSRSKVIRTNAYAEVDHTQDIMGNLLPTKSVSAVIIGRHNFVENTSIRIRLYSGLDQTTEIHDSGVLTVAASEAGSDPISWGAFIWGGEPWGADSLSEEYAPKANYVYWITTPVTSVQSFKISIVVDALEVEIGRLIIGNYIEPTYNLSFGHTLSWVETTKQYRTEGGSLRSDIAIPFRRIEFDINTIDETGRSVLQSSLRYVGLRKDLFLSLFPEDTDLTKKIDYSGIMKLTKVPSMQEFAPKYYKSKYVMEEV